VVQRAQLVQACGCFPGVASSPVGSSALVVIRCCSCVRYSGRPLPTVVPPPDTLNVFPIFLHRFKRQVCEFP